MKKYRVGVIGATGMVGQRFVTLLQEHPWFDLAVLAASESSAGKTYQSAVAGRWAFPWPVPEKAVNSRCRHRRRPHPQRQSGERLCRLRRMPPASFC